MISEGIEAFLPDEGKAASPSNPFSTRAGFRLQVREEDEDRAVEIINQAYAIAG